MGRSSPPLAHRTASMRGARRRGQGVENSCGADPNTLAPSCERRNEEMGSVLDSGRGRPVRRILDSAMRGRPMNRPTHAIRQRQLRDEVKSGGNQPTDIRVIHRRPDAARGLNLHYRLTETTAVPVALWTSPSDRHVPDGPYRQPLDNADALPTACPHSRASRPRTPPAQRLI